MDNETVYFGGAIFGGAAFTNQTWVFANGTWENETNPFDAPPARNYPSMDFDPNMEAVLLFGGNSLNGSLNDTWTFSAGVWTNLTFVGPAPSARYGAGLAFDPQPEENGSVLYGGYGTVGYPTDTWVWESWSGWIQLFPSSGPPELANVAMAYDAVNGYIVLFGGYGPTLGYGSETWEFYSGQWWHVFPITSPTGRELGVMTYFPSYGSDLLFGGWSGSVELNDTWLFSNTTWTQEKPLGSPAARDSPGLALDGTGTAPVVVGGDNLTQGFGDTWAYEYSPTVALSAAASSAQVTEPVTFTLTFAAGTAPYRAAVDFGDGSNAFVTSELTVALISHVYNHPGTFRASVDVQDAVGALCSATAGRVTVTDAPVVTATASPSEGDVGTPIKFAASAVSGGIPPVTFAWQFGDGQVGSGPNVTHSYLALGTYLVSVTGTDSGMASASKSLQVVVVPDPSVAVAVTPTSSTPGVALTLYANVTGGTGPYTYAWSLGDGKTSAVPTPQMYFPAAGQYTVQVWVNDSVGASAHGSTAVSVGSNTTTSSTGSSGYPSWFWLAIGALVAVGVVGSAVLVWRGRSGRT